MNLGPIGRGGGVLPQLVADMAGLHQIWGNQASDCGSTTAAELNFYPQTEDLLLESPQATSQIPSTSVG